MSPGTRDERRHLYADILNSLYELGTQGHIEDIAIAGDMQGKKLGVKLIQALDHIANEVGCYKVCIHLQLPQGLTNV